MRKYEFYCLLKSSFDIENNDQIISSIEKNIEEIGGKVTETNKIGRKKLAYEVNGNRDAFCVTFNIEIAPDKIKEIKRYFKLNDSVLRDFVTTLKSSSKKEKKEALA